jgi:hypothetical protein
VWYRVEYLEVVVVEERAGHHLKLKIALSWAHKHTQLVAVVAGRNWEVGAQVAVTLYVFQAEEEPTNGSYWMVQINTGLMDDILHKHSLATLHLPTSRLLIVQENGVVLGLKKATYFDRHRAPSSLHVAS